MVYHSGVYIRYSRPLLFGTLRKRGRTYIYSFIIIVLGSIRRWFVRRTEQAKERRKTKKRKWRSSRSGLACCDCIYTSSVLDWTWVAMVKSAADESRSIETPKEVEMSFYFQKPGFKVSFEYIWIARGWLELSAELVILPSTSSEALTKPSQRPSKISCCRECVNVRYRHLYPHTHTAGSQFGVFTHNLENTKKELEKDPHRSTSLASSPHQTRRRSWEFLPVFLRQTYPFRS